MTILNTVISQLSHGVVHLLTGEAGRCGVVMESGTEDSREGLGIQTSLPIYARVLYRNCPECL